MTRCEVDHRGAMRHSEALCPIRGGGSELPAAPSGIRSHCSTRGNGSNMKITPTILLFLLAARLNAAGAEAEEPATPRPRGSHSRFAALDDVRSLANGLLHLGQSLREFVDNTRTQINNIFQKLNIFDRSFDQLTLLASEIKEEEEELKKTTVALQANNEEIKGLSAQINSRVDSILLEKSSLRDKLQGLEEKLSSVSLSLTSSKHAAEIVGLRVSHVLFTATEDKSKLALLCSTVAE